MGRKTQVCLVFQDELHALLATQEARIRCCAHTGACSCSAFVVCVGPNLSRAEVDPGLMLPYGSLSRTSKFRLLSVLICFMLSSRHPLCRLCYFFSLYGTPRRLVTSYTLRSSTLPHMPVYHFCRSSLLHFLYAYTRNICIITPNTNESCRSTSRLTASDTRSQSSIKGCSYILNCVSTRTRATQWATIVRNVNDR